MYSILNDGSVELHKAPPIPEVRNFALKRLFLLLFSGVSLFQLLKIKYHFHDIIILGSDQPAGFVASILGKMLKIFGKLGNKHILIIYDSHGSRCKLAQDLSPPLPYKILSIFEDVYSVKTADMILSPSLADYITYNRIQKKISL